MMIARYTFSSCNGNSNVGFVDEEEEKQNRAAAREREEAQGKESKSAKRTCFMLCYFTTSASVTRDFLIVQDTQTVCGNFVL